MHGDGRRVLLRRLQHYEQGLWPALLAAARAARASTRPATDLDTEAVAECRQKAACARARRGELSRARQLLTAAELAPGDEATRAALTDPAKRPPQPREPIPPEVLQFQPPTPVRLTSAAVARSLREAKRGSAPGLSGARAEHYKLLLGHADDMELLTEAANLLARACSTRYRFRGCVVFTNLLCSGPVY